MNEYVMVPNKLDAVYWIGENSVYARDGSGWVKVVTAPAPPSAEGEKEAFERVVVEPLRGRYDEKQRVADFAMFSLGYRAAAPVSTQQRNSDIP